MAAINDSFRNFQNMLPNCEAVLFSPPCERLHQSIQQISADITFIVKRLSGLLPPQRLQEMQDFLAKLTRMYEAFEQHLTSERMGKLKTARDKLPKNLPEDVKDLSESQVEMLKNTIGMFSEMLGERAVFLGEMNDAMGVGRTIIADMHKCIKGMRVDGAEIPDDLLVKLNDLAISGGKIDEVLAGLKLNE